MKRNVDNILNSKTPRGEIGRVTENLTSKIEHQRMKKSVKVFTDTNSKKEKLSNDEKLLLLFIKSQIWTTDELCSKIKMEELECLGITKDVQQKFREVIKSGDYKTRLDTEDYKKNAKLYYTLYNILVQKKQIKEDDKLYRFLKDNYYHC